MSELKFRGKVEGKWWHTTPDGENWQQFWVLVDKSTVGQYIGLKDEQGTEMYAGDILGWSDDKTRAVIEYYTGDPGGGKRQATWVPRRMLYENGHGIVVDVSDERPYNYWDDDRWDDWLVVGNIHDHPEMLTMASTEQT